MKPLKGNELEKWLEKNGEPEDYNPWIKLDDPYESFGTTYEYGFRCFNCGQVDEGVHSTNQNHPKGQTKLCSNCFYSLPNLEI